MNYPDLLDSFGEQFILSAAKCGWVRSGKNILIKRVALNRLYKAKKWLAR